MKRLMLISIILVFSVAVPAQDRDSKNAALFRFGVTAPTFGGPNRNDTAAALLAWARAIVKEKHLNLHPQMTVFTRYADLRSAFLQDRLDAATLSVEELINAFLVSYKPFRQKPATRALQP